MANKEVVYKPLSDTSKIQEIATPTKIDTPDYPDLGVSFAGYSKTLISGTTYKLNPQQLKQISLYSSFGGAFTSAVINKTELQEKDFYVTDIYLALFSQYAGASLTSYVYIRDGVGGTRRVSVSERINTAANNFNTYVLHFDNPLKFSKENQYIEIAFQTARIAGDSISITLSGWIE